MAVNKVIYNGATLVDLTGVTVTADDMAAGKRAMGADGNPIVGLMQKVTIDAELSTTSTNPVQNKVIAEAIANMGGGSGGGGVSTSEVNTWTAEQIFNDITISGVKKSEYLIMQGDTITPTSSYTIWSITGPVGTLNLDGLIAKVNNSLHFEVLFIRAGADNAPILKIISTKNYDVFCPKTTRCCNLFNMLHGVIVKDTDDTAVVFIKIDTFEQDGSSTIS